MPQYNVRGVKVEFPFQAYEVQQIYMEKVIEALQDVRALFFLRFFFKLCVFFFFSLFFVE